ncbi:MAG: ferrochelatase [Bacteroidales bacterium]|jgi:ferrochelatase|nr:ferrochelatase [Bacteroidales bacterium]
MKTAILIVNIGTPDSPDITDVRKFITNYLTDPHVMNIPWVWRQLLVRGVIVPFRARKSAKAYRQLWTENGSPLRYYLDKLHHKVQEQLPATAVWSAVRYGSRNIAEVMAEMSTYGYEQLTVVPLFPQYTSSTVGTIEDGVRKAAARWTSPPQLTVIRQFSDYTPFIDLWSRNILAQHPENYDKLVFSFHGLPLGHLPKRCRNAKDGQPCSCASHNGELQDAQIANYCYRANCYALAAQIAKSIGLGSQQYTVGFQSRLTKGWLQPFIDSLLEQYARKGMKVLLAAPSFVTDCLETTVELDIDNKNMFLAAGGKELKRVPSLNVQDEWVKVLANLCSNH